MLEHEDILVFAPERWEGVWRNRHQIMSRLARNNKVLWVEPRPYLRHVLRDMVAGGPRHPSAAAGTRARGLCHVRDGLHMYAPARYAPVAGRQPLKGVFELLRMRSLHQAMRQLGMREPILWLCRPWQADVQGRCGERLLVYHVVDEYAMYEAEFASKATATRQAAIAAQEEELLAQADLVIVTSPPLLESKRRFNPHTYLVRNGVDAAAYRAVVQDGRPPPEEITALPGPVIGYAGVVNEKIDLALLRNVAASRPDWSLVIIGPVTLRYHREQLAWLDLPNIHLLGYKPVEELPRYIAACQVCLMPYKINEWTRHIDPLKMYEYMAAGRPVVSTEIPSARDFSPPVRLADDLEGFVAAIEGALQQGDEGQREALMAWAADHDWQARVERISELVEQALARR